MMDGVGTMEPGSNRLMVSVNVESIAQVKVLTSSYQAEYGRSSGLQVTAVTRSGTNRFRGSLYDVERNSDWNSNSKTNILNGDPKTTLKQRDWGFSVGGPVGKPGGQNKLFFFFAQEFQPREQGNNVDPSPHADRSSSGRATSRRRRTTTATRGRSSAITGSPAPAAMPIAPRASPTAACSARFRPIACTKSA